jgi:predicted AAA+ superfamily ATPase
MSLKPWREVAVPHADVRAGTFQQSEFAADITAVHSGKAPKEYSDAAAFFERTFITEGMGALLRMVAERLSGKAGEPVVQLQTGFGGGKTHTLLAVYHMACRSCALSALPGLSPVIERAGLMDVPRAKVAVLDGTNHGPGAPWKRDGQQVRTLWGDLAAQLAGAEGFALVKDADATGTSPGKEALRALLAKAAPCVVLVDELVVYLRQFGDGQALSGGTFESNLSFFQALTEAVKLVPGAVVLASLPDSRNAGGDRGQQALSALEAIFKRVEALWKPVGTEEGFEIIRRRLFEPVRDEAARDAVCRAFADAYKDEATKLPAEAHEARYRERLARAYPLHPEVFDRLYEDWGALENFQRTRGVLKLLAKVIHRLWKDNNTEPMILPGSLPLYDSAARSDLVAYLKAGWEPVVERDIDGEGAETARLESDEPRFGSVNAARRVARALFLATAPGGNSTIAGARGLDRARLLLGCLQPGQTSGVYSDALNRLADKLHYLNSNGDRAAPTTRYWFDTIANLRREMEDRKGRFSPPEVRARLEAAVRHALPPAPLFDGIHAFAPHKDVPDDDKLRLVALPPEVWYAKGHGHQPAEGAVREYLRSHGDKPRHRANRLLFVAADQGALMRFQDEARAALSWKSIVDDIESSALVIDKPREKQARHEAAESAKRVLGLARECYKWLLVPAQSDPHAADPEMEVHPLSGATISIGESAESVCVDNEVVIKEWSPKHLRTALQEHYWKYERVAIGAQAFWDDTQKYLYLPRLRNRAVLERAVKAGAASADYFGTAHGKTATGFEGFKLADADILFADTLLLIEPGAATKHAYALKPPPAVVVPPVVPPTDDGTGGKPPVGPGPTPPPDPTAKKYRSFSGAADVSASNARQKLIQLAEEIVAVLSQDPTATVKVSVEISAEFPSGAPDHVKRAVSENANTLGLKRKEWE